MKQMTKDKLPPINKEKSKHLTINKFGRLYLSLGAAELLKINEGDHITFWYDEEKCYVGKTNHKVKTYAMNIAGSSLKHNDKNLTEWLQLVFGKIEGKSMKIIIMSEPIEKGSFKLFHIVREKITDIVADL